MRLIFYILIFCQLFNILLVSSEEVKKVLFEQTIKWEKLPDQKSSKLKKIIWKSYKNDQSYFGNEVSDDNSENSFINEAEKIKLINQHRIIKKSLQIQPHIPSNNFLNYGDLIISTNWKSAFSGGAGGGTGHQNYAVRFDYGLNHDSLLSLYLSEADDPLYNLIDGELIPNNWASAALGYKKNIFESDNSKNSLSFAGSIEYWVVSSGASYQKSIYNEVDNEKGLDRHENLIYSFSLPFSKRLNNRTDFSIVPGAIFIPEKLGNKNIGKNFYGNNYFLASGLSSLITDNLKLIGSYTYLLGPGHNNFDEGLKFHRKPIYSYGFSWEASPIIDIEGKITNGYGITPSTSLLTIPSDNKPLYYLGGNYRPFADDIEFNPLNSNNHSLLFGGLTVENAIFPERGITQININYDQKGNLFAFYGYSLSNIFQLELSTGSFNDVNLINPKFQSTYLNEDSFYYRFGGKLSIFSPQKNDLFWTTLRLSLGRNEGENHQGYMFTELINTFRINDWLAFNVSPKYVFSGVKSFGGIGVSSYIKLLDNLQLIPEINTSLNNDSEFNSTLALRYSYAPAASIDLYYSNAAGTHDIGQLLEDKEYKLGIKLNFLY